ncbi:MAG: penicillin-binding protein 2 [Coriobacteriia bacterium]
MSETKGILRTRLGVLGVLVLLVIGTLLVRLWSLQVLQGEAFALQAENNRIREVSIDAPRGRILDRQGRELVTNRPALAVAVEPSAIDDQETLLRLSNVIRMPVSEIEERLRTVREEPLKPRIVKADVSLEVASLIEEHASSFPGVSIETIPVRQYPNGSLAAHVLGYTGEISEDQLKTTEFADYELGDIVGKTGAEAEFEGVLQGEKGYKWIEVDARGVPRRVLDEREPVAGRDVVLTLDLEIQRVAEQALADAIEDAHSQEYPNARAGAIVVLDVRSGEVLAMASAPTYDPEVFIGGVSTEEWEALTDEESEYPLNNRAVMSAYPPASTFKVITGVAGLEEGVTSPWSNYYCAGKWTEMGEQWPKYCWKRSGHGTISFMEGVEESCDTVFYEIGYEFYKTWYHEGSQLLQKWAFLFGLGDQTGIDLPAEVSGRIPTAEWKREFNEYYPEYQMWLPGDTVNMAIGQGDVLVTPLQMANVFATLGNGGDVMRPHVLKAVLDAEGEVAKSEEPSVTAHVPVSDETLSTMRTALERVTESGTGASAFRGFPVRVAGKTGTAEVRGKDDYAWFAAYAPADDPQYSVAVVIEQGGHGGAVAAPAARQVLSALFGLPVERVHATDPWR